MVLQPGKYITYRLDSLVFTNFGKNTEIHKYQMKHEIDAELVDTSADLAGAFILISAIQQVRNPGTQ